MKRNLMPGLIAGLLTFGAVTVPFALSASAQTQAPGSTDTTGTQTQTDVADDNDADWGWLGLLGLFGLAGLARKRQDPNVRYRESEDVGTTTRRY